MAKTTPVDTIVDLAPVVAAEVRNLAQRSATLAKEIKRLINESTERVEEGSALVNQCGQTLEEIVSATKRVADIMGEISAASQEQSNGIEQVNRSILQMNEMTQQNAALVEEASSSSRTMKEQAESLKHEVDFFKLSDKDGEAVSSRPSPGQVKEGTPTPPAGQKAAGV